MQKLKNVTRFYKDVIDFCAFRRPEILKRAAFLHMKEFLRKQRMLWYAKIKTIRQRKIKVWSQWRSIFIS